MHRVFPYVLCYTGFDQAELYIDASISGNEMKNIRCSCSPNAKVCDALLLFSCFLFSLDCVILSRLFTFTELCSVLRTHATDIYYMRKAYTVLIRNHIFGNNSVKP